MKKISKIKREPHNPAWAVVTVKSPVMWETAYREVWSLWPGRRYVLNLDDCGDLYEHEKIDTVSDLKSQGLYKPLHGSQDWRGKRVLIERHRSRGIGDFLFLSGIFAYLQSRADNRMRLHTYTSTTNAQIFKNNECLEHKMAFTGPMEYDALSQYDFHWYIDAATEFSEDKDQLNSYDSLLNQLGIDWTTVRPEFKRPRVHLSWEDKQMIGDFYRHCKTHGDLNLSESGFYVIAPFTNSVMRTGSYRLWLDLIGQLSKKKPVVVIGVPGKFIHGTDISGEQFISEVENFPSDNVVSMIGQQLTVRLTLAILAEADALFCLDSGPLFMAQASRTPAISLWGIHDPFVRIGYDPEYMELAIWNKESCHHSPCYVFDAFPEHKCPQGANQKLCSVLGSVNVGQLMEKLEIVEKRNRVAPRTSVVSS